MKDMASYTGAASCLFFLISVVSLVSGICNNDVGNNEHMMKFSLTRLLASQVDFLSSEDLMCSIQRRSLQELMSTEKTSNREVTEEEVEKACISTSQLQSILKNVTTTVTSNDTISSVDSTVSETKDLLLGYWEIQPNEKSVVTLLLSDTTLQQYGMSLLPYGYPTAIGILLLLFWLFILLPQLCCRPIRKCFCCCRLKKRHISLSGFLFIFAFFIVFTALITVTAAFGIYYSLETTEGARGIRCEVFKLLQTFLHGTETINVTNTTSTVSSENSTKINVEIEKFIGLNEAQALITEIAQDLNGTVISGISDLVIKELAFTDKITNMIFTMDNLLSAVKNNVDPPKNFFHTCVFCEQSQAPLNEANRILTSGVVPSLLSLKEKLNQYLNPEAPMFTTAQTVMATQIDMLNGFRNESLDWFVGEIKSYQPVVEQGIVIGDITLSVISSIGLIIAILTVLWLLLIWITGKKNRASSIIPCCCWNLFCIYSIIVFILGGCVILILTPVMQACSYIQNDIILNDGWNNFVKNLTDSEMALTLIDTCFSNNSDGDLLRALNLSESLSFQSSIDEQLNSINTEISKNTENIDITPINQLMDATLNYSWIYLPNLQTFDTNDLTINTNNKIISYPEVLISGVQNENVIITDPMILVYMNGTSTLNGLTGIQEKIKPFHFSILTGVNNETSIDSTFNPDIASNPIIALNNETRYINYRDSILAESGLPPPNNTDPANVMLYTNTDNAAKLADALTRAIVDSVMWVNSLWWAAQKANVRESTDFECKDTQNSTYRCTWDEFSPYITSLNNVEQSYLARTVNELQRYASELSISANGKASSIIGGIREIIATLFNKVETLLRSLNCQFLGASFSNFITITCDHTTPDFLMTGISWVFSGLVALILAIMTLFLWRLYLDNKIKRRESGLLSGAYYER